MTTVSLEADVPHETIIQALQAAGLYVFCDGRSVTVSKRYPETVDDARDAAAALRALTEGCD